MKNDICFPSLLPTNATGYSVVGLGSRLNFFGMSDFLHDHFIHGYTSTELYVHLPREFESCVLTQHVPKLLSDSKMGTYYDNWIDGLTVE